jgi:hypothetical protein
VAGEASHALHNACIEVMSHASAQQRLAALQPADISSVSEAAFEEHMAGCVVLLLLLLLLLWLMLSHLHILLIPQLSHNPTLHL